MSSRSRAVRGCVMFRRMGKVSPPCKRTIEALRVCSVNMMYFSIFIVFVRPNVTGSLRFSTWGRPFHDSRASKGDRKGRPYMSALQIKVDRVLPGSSLPGDPCGRPYISCAQNSSPTLLLCTCENLFMLHL